MLDTGRNAAIRLGRWQDALDLNAAQVTSMRGRRAPAAVTARSRFNDYGPLLRLGRTEEALALLLESRQVFQDARDTEMLGKPLSALADIENDRGHGDAARSAWNAARCATSTWPGTWPASRSATTTSRSSSLSTPASLPRPWPATWLQP